MFKLTRPCPSCPFRKGVPFRFDQRRLDGIVAGPAFQCHSTIDYDQWDDVRGRQGDHPQQCAGLMSLLWRENLPNEIMRFALATGHLHPGKLEHVQVYDSLADAYAASGCVYDRSQVVRMRRDQGSHLAKVLTELSS